MTKSEKARIQFVRKHTVHLPQNEQEVLDEMMAIIKSPSRRDDVLIALRGIVVFAERAKHQEHVDFIGRIMATWIDFYRTYQEQWTEKK